MAKTGQNSNRQSPPKSKQQRNAFEKIVVIKRLSKWYRSLYLRNRSGSDLSKIFLPKNLHPSWFWIPRSGQIQVYLSFVCNTIFVLIPCNTRHEPVCCPWSRFSEAQLCVANGNATLDNVYPIVLSLEAGRSLLITSLIVQTNHSFNRAINKQSAPDVYICGQNLP